ncbi:unnamed protein product [Cuscuta campestris]|uniref:F-box domain-containing protein n=1 Tax=Cuscuta campestris TaxID=132261 RepID=A0A484L0X7_9ASTE|nr:unnamed protein product [Cuscuta campestris]
MSDIPSEIVADFLSRVPALSLLRFRCVSKSWRSMIDSPHFIKMHLNRTLQTNSDRKLILRSCYLYSADFDLLEKTNRADYTELDYPLKRDDIGINVVGSCHGILCLDGGVEDKDIVLWNPTTRKQYALPFSEFEFPGDDFFCTSRLVYGFGYDKVSDDYKVLRIIQSFDCESEVKVFSMKSKSWRKIDCFPYYLKFKRVNGVLASGSLHWVVCSDADAETEYLIAAFDLETEEYRLVPQPDYPRRKRKFHMNVLALGGYLCMMCNYLKSKCVDIWVMKNYPAKESWTKLLTIRESDTNAKSFDYVTPVAYSRSGREVFMVVNDMLPLWYDLEKRQISYTTFSISESLNFMEHHVCFGSLVKLDSGIAGSAERVPDKREVVASRRGAKKKGNKKSDNFLSEGFKLVL